MFGFSYKWIFKSRWVALAFAAFVCWSAAQYAGPDETAEPSTAGAHASQDDAALANLVRAREQLDPQ